VQVELFSAQPDLPTLEKPHASGQLLGAQAQATQLLEVINSNSPCRRRESPRPRHKAPGVLVLIGHAGGKPLIAGKTPRRLAAATGWRT
jgi:iron complex transport system substrate-binding protein